MIRKEFYTKLVEELRARNVTLVAVSKTHPPELIRELYNLGQRDFGENRVQELLPKQRMLPPDIRWHLIGHLQRNKVRQCLGVVSMIESVDSIRLLKTIEKEATAAGVTVDILLQIKIAQEESKYGFNPETIANELTQAEVHTIRSVRFRGVMGMASFVEDEGQIRSEFRRLRTCFEQLQNRVFAHSADFNQISMGMSGDYRIAIEEGSTMVRIGSLLFGERQ